MPPIERWEYIDCTLEEKSFCPSMYDRIHGPAAAAIEAYCKSKAISVLLPSLSSNTRRIFVQQ